MRLRLLARWLGGGFVAGMSLPSQLAAQSQPPAVRDLVVRGRNAINDLRYGEAAILSRQILAIGTSLTRQQTIDALQILAAAMYPEGAAQRPDSAKAVMRRLVAMGVHAGMPKDLVWSGLDSLYRVVLKDSMAIRDARPAPGSVVARELLLRDSASHVLSLVSEKLPAEQIVDRVRFDCYSVVFDSLDAALTRAQMPATLGAALRGTCTKLDVKTEPAGGTVSINGRELGPIGANGGSWWVDPASAVTLTVRNGDGSGSSTTELPRGKEVTARFVFARDTQPWPLARTAVEIGDSLRIFDGWTPPTSTKPAPPTPPRAGGRSFKTKLLFGLVGAGAGFALGKAICIGTETVPPGEVWIVGGTSYVPGQSVPVGKGAGCSAGTAAGGGLAAFFVASIGGKKGTSGTSPRYEREMAAYPAVVREWEQRERSRYAEQHPRVRQAMATYQSSLTLVKSANASIRAGNGKLAVPQISMTDLPGALLGSLSDGLPSEVDIFVPKAAAPNPAAVAVALGNRSYATGLPRPAYATKDALSARNYFVEVFGLSADRVIVDSNATNARMGALLGTEGNEIVWQLAEIVASSPPNSVDVILFYSGLATREGNPSRNVLLPVDATAEKSQGLGMDQLFRNLTALNARSVTVFVDASFSGQAEGGAVFEGKTVPAADAARARPSNMDVFYAAGPDQVARARRDQGHGVFTFFVLKGLGGAADANSDLKVTVGELDDYVKAQVRGYAQTQLNGARQNPESVIANRNRVLVTLAKKP